MRLLTARRSPPHSSVLELAEGRLEAVEGSGGRGRPVWEVKRGVCKDAPGDSRRAR